MYLYGNYMTVLEKDVDRGRRKEISQYYMVIESSTVLILQGI